MATCGEMRRWCALGSRPARVSLQRKETWCGDFGGKHSCLMSGCGDCASGLAVRPVIPHDIEANPRKPFSIGQQLPTRKLPRKPSERKIVDGLAVLIKDWRRDQHDIVEDMGFKRNRVADVRIDLLDELS